MKRPADTSITQILPLSVDPGLRRSFRFGLLLEVLDRLAEQTALAYAEADRPGVHFVTAAIDQIRLRGALDVSRDLTMLSRVNYVGTSSLEVGIRVEQPGDTHFGSCYFTMVALPRGIELPPMTYQSEVERRRKAEALERRASPGEGAAVEPPTPQERAMLAELHMALEGRGFDGRLLCDLVERSYEQPHLEHERAALKISGGFVIHRAYLHAAACAELVAPDRALLVAVNRINFLQPVRSGDTLHFTSRVTYTGATSICVEVDIVRESSDRNTAALCNTCTFTFRNVDDALNGCPVPKVYPTTYAEDLRYLAAHRRRQARLGVPASS
ncbi:MAG TPA: hotdog domain-containing protein [Alphaproteobacteria bacterium]|nr:hotdog domain-containing protein [Alphaproteobacteria bacterium]